MGSLLWLSMLSTRIVYVIFLPSRFLAPCSHCNSVCSMLFSVKFATSVHYLLKRGHLLSWVFYNVSENIYILKPHDISFSIFLPTTMTHNPRPTRHLVAIIGNSRLFFRELHAARWVCLGGKSSHTHASHAGWCCCSRLSINRRY